MRKYFCLSCCLLLIVLLITGCQSAPPKTTGVNNTIDMKIDKVIKYKNSYVGDNSAVGTTVCNLPGGQYVRIMSLATVKPPLGITVKYGLRGDSGLKEEDFNKYWSAANTKRVFLNNATTLFILIKNVDTVTFNLDTANKQSFTVQRKDLEAFYGKDLRQYADNLSLWEKEVLEQNINSDVKVEDFFKTHKIIGE